MADETPNTQHLATIDRLGTKLRAYVRRAKAAEAEAETLKAAKTSLETAKASAETELASLKAKTDVPAALKRVDELTSELRGIKHRQVFDRIAAEAGVKPGALDDLHQLSGYKAETDVVDEAAVKAAIDGQKTARAYLFGAADETTDEAPAVGTTPAVLPPGPGVSRGGSVVKGPQKFTEAQLSDPAFVMNNYEAITAAAKDNIERGRA